MKIISLWRLVIILGISDILLAICVSAHAQQTKVSRIGALVPGRIFLVRGFSLPFPLALYRHSNLGLSEKSERQQAIRSSCPAANEIRASHQPENRQADRSHDSTQCAGAGR
jgi:hypothetical protein